IGKTVSFVTKRLPAKTRVFWGLSAYPSKQVKVLLLCNPSSNSESRENHVHIGDSRIRNSIALLPDSKHLSTDSQIRGSVALLPDFTSHRIFDDDLSEIDTMLGTGFLASNGVVNPSRMQEWNGNSKRTLRNGFTDLKENDASMYVFNEGGLLLAHVPGSDVAADSAPESEPMILSGLLSAMQKMSGSLVGSELDSFKAGNKTCLFKKMETNGETVLNGVAIYNTARDSEQKVVSCLNGLLEIVNSMYRSSVSEMCMKDRVDIILKEQGVIPAVNICAY
ncbi:MAG: hypothetical protein ACFFD4_25070, partial [Candidatus Odinarchaeota archaeon]